MAPPQPPRRDRPPPRIVDHDYRATQVTTPSVEKPKYGGAITIPLTADIVNFEEMYGWHPGAALLKLTNEELLTGDWKGTRRTDEVDWR